MDDKFFDFSDAPRSRSSFPLSMATYDLSANSWRLGRLAPMPVDAAFTLSDPLDGWMPARVPGSIQRDLMNAGRLPDLYHRLQLDDVLREVDESDWIYETDLPAIDAAQRAWVEFRGIDYFAAVIINQHELERRAGMYSRRRYEVSSFLQHGAATLRVRIWGAWALPRWKRTRAFRLKKWIASHVQRNLPPYDDRLLTLKAPVHFGWDFSPRLLTAGIWDDAILHLSGPIAITDLWARADWGPEYGLVVKLYLDALHPAAVTVSLRLESLTTDEPEQTAEFRLRLQQGRTVRHLCWPDVDLRPWSTHDLGTPHRYRLVVSIFDEHGTLSDEREQVIGSRRFGWRIDRGVYYPLLNGQPIRFRGINWTPLDLLPGSEEEEARYRQLLQQAVEAGVNAVRVWGGGGRERPIFYELCDALGLLVWQEMPISCVFFGELPQDDRFLRLVRRETQGIIRSLRHHPSIFMWVGGNEWGPGRFKRVARAMGEIAAREDPSRRWVPASPGPHDSHQWLVWHEKASPEVYAQDPAPLMSEFGLAAPPSPPILQDMLPGEALWPPGDGWRRRHAEIEKLWHYARFFLRPGPSSQEGLASDQISEARLLQDFVDASQQAQARGLQRGMEAYRLREKAVGTFIWQWNEPWPAISWSVFPYAGRPKQAFEQIKRSYAPLLPMVQFRPKSMEIWVVNDAGSSPGLCTLEVWLNAQRLWTTEISPPAHRRMRVHTLPLPPGQGLLKLRLHGPGVDIVNDYPYPWPFPQEKRWHLRGWLAGLVMRWLLRW